MMMMMMHFIDKSSIVTVESRNEIYSLKIRLCSGQVVSNFQHIAITKQNTPRRTISKLG